MKKRDEVPILLIVFFSAFFLTISTLLYFYAVEGDFDSKKTKKVLVKCWEGENCLAKK